MKAYIGTKIIQAEIPDQGDPARDKGEDGYKVIYADGYESWSPRQAFEDAYQSLDAMSFGHAVVMLKAGKKVARAGWNGAGMFLFLVAGSHFKVNRPPLLGIYPEGTGIDYRPHIDMKTAQGDVVPWVASQSDILSDDWMLV